MASALGRFDAAVLAGVVLVTTGAVLGNGVLFMSATVPFVYAVAATVSRPPPPSITVERSFDPAVVTPGQPTTVTLTVRNEGDRILPDVRVHDRPPEQVRVMGRPCGCLSLRPGETDTISYEVVAGDGEYDFGDPTARFRPLSAVESRTDRLAASGDETLRCRPLTTAPEIRAAADQRIGIRTADTPGSGLEFHSVREHRHGDAASRVDWRGFAKTGDMTTVNFRETNASETAVVVDARTPGRVVRAPGHPTAAEFAAHAAEQLVDRLLAADHRVGLAALGIDAEAVGATTPSDRAGRPWVPIGDDATTRTRTEAVLKAVIDAAAAERAAPQPAFAGSVRHRAEATNAAALRDRLPRASDVVLVSPLLDDAPLSLARTLSAAGHAVVVVSPNMADRARDATENGIGARVAGIQRDLRLRRLRSRDIRVVDWETTGPLSVAMEGSA
ncbi:DUF58 domain-containing protein [Natronomonas halophila]|uniref:DUF58 domain-containing protein n=1 Tax=Natronomonas halophila TaxID=2747817 RepID=UPI0015B55CA1|nr:DUF58 domain-containing protein [Natronomonas halophila]QLD86346.1 DUF58 domain-containing protein [Natronomonas halophila]